MLSALPVTTRFRLYSEWKTIFTASEKPAFAAAKAVAESDTQKVMRRLSKDNVKEFGRKLSKVAHANPLAVMQAIVVQIEAYTNMIGPVCDAFKYLTALGYDVLTFVVIEKLAEGREKLKDDGQNVSLWLSALATFCGHLAKKYAGIELSALLQYLVNTLKDNQSLDLLVLKELITRMTGNEALEDMSDAQARMSVCLRPPSPAHIHTAGVYTPSIVCCINQHQAAKIVAYFSHEKLRECTKSSVYTSQYLRSVVYFFDLLFERLFSRVNTIRVRVSGHGAPSARVQAMSGGETLRSEAINFNSTMLPKVRAKGVARLRDALQKGAKGGDALTVPLLAGVAHSPNTVITPAPSTRHRFKNFATSSYRPYTPQSSCFSRRERMNE